MLQLQQKLNDTTSGKGWENGLTNKGKLIDWRRCIYLEAAELVDSYPWKHWKNIDAQPDYENIKIEIVDIWHFVMSEALRVYKVEGLGGMSDLSVAIHNLPSFENFAADVFDNDTNMYKQISKVEDFIAVLFTQTDVHKWLAAFFTMSAGLKLGLDELYRLYIGKNILNRFRQEHGYKEGKYIKRWNGVEDNVVMQQILEEDKEITPETLYRQLENKYPN